LLTDRCAGGEKFKFYIEMACNDLFGPGDGGINPPPTNSTYTINRADLQAINLKTRQIMYDYQIIMQMARNLDWNHYRAPQAMFTANAIMNTFRKNKPETWDKCLELSHEFLSKTNGESQHLLNAIGHCHIDTAWLWPYAETRRKVARSWSTQIKLMELYPEHQFAASSAAQYEFVLQDYPKLFELIKKKFDSKQFWPVGGTWVEMDCNVPSGEALCRQFILGQGFFKEHFNFHSQVFWLPDTFGYSSQLPQIVRQSGMKYFFTQKISWNNINRFPHTTFLWEGLDGSQILAHMAPSETYNAQVEVEELKKSVYNNHDRPYTNESILLFGNGDGGGGPIPEMIERLRRLSDNDGLPKTKYGNVEDFYKRLETNSKEFVKWRGELYFELHRGTYTTHAAVKRYNRKSEFLLRDLEILSVFASKLTKGYNYPKNDIKGFWKNVCRNQFHDVLPGTCIELAYEEVYKLYEQVQYNGTKLIDSAFDAVVGDSTDLRNNHLVVFNSLGWPRTSLLEVEYSNYSNLKEKMFHQVSKDLKRGYLLVKDLKPFGFTSIDVSTFTSDGEPGEIDFYPANAHTHDNPSTGKAYILENQLVKVQFNDAGQIISYYDKSRYRELIPKGQYGNTFKMYEDTPFYWDAWDVEVFHLEKFDTIESATVNVFEEGPVVARLQITYQFSSTSKGIVVASLYAHSPIVEFNATVDWRENRQLLKVEFPWNLHSDVAIYDTQFGHITRPTHFNTSWDLAKFEVCGHKFADLSEYGYGIALLNDCKYGYSTHGNVMRLTLLKAPKAPDANADMGHHEFKYAIYPHNGAFQESDVVNVAYEFNTGPIFKVTNKSQADSLNSSSLFALDGTPNVILETVKQSEEGSDTVIRFFESLGGRGHAKISSAIKFSKVVRVNILETEEPNTESIHLNEDGSFDVELKPFQILTLKLIK
jgi:alpha-mannosidase